jgi:hypothetical protein
MKTEVTTPINASSMATIEPMRVKPRMKRAPAVSGAVGRGWRCGCKSVIRLSELLHPLRSTFLWTPTSRPACATATPRSLTSCDLEPTEFRLWMTHLRLHETPNLGVHETGSSSILGRIWRGAAKHRGGLRPRGTRSVPRLPLNRLRISFIVPKVPGLTALIV